MSHFANSVYAELAAKIQNLAETVKEDFISDQSFDSYGCTNINEISGKSYDGFIAFQDGGFEVSELYRSDTDSSYHLTQAQTDTMNERQEFCYECFRSDNKELNLPEDYGYADIPEEFQNHFTEYEAEFFEPALMRFETWVDRDQSQSIFLRLSLNYRDQPYYRSKYDETLFEIKVTAEQFLSKDNEFFIKLFNRKMKSVK